MVPNVETLACKSVLEHSRTRMNDLAQLDELMTCRIGDGRKVVEPSSIIIFGASGDLTARKLIPALYHLFSSGALPDPVRIIGFARREKSHNEWREELLQDCTLVIGIPQWQMLGGSRNFDDLAVNLRKKK